MKKIFVMVLAIAMVLSLAACNTQPSQNATATTPAAQETKPNMSESLPTVEPGVLYEEGGIKLTLKGVADTDTGKTIFLVLDNATDRAVTFTCNNASVNGYTVEAPRLRLDVAAGKSGEGEIAVPKNALTDNGIVGFTLLDCDLLDGVTYQVLVENINMSHGTSVSVSETLLQNMLFTNGNLYIYNGGIKKNENNEEILTLYFDNRYDANLSVSVEVSALNDVAVEGKQTLSANKGSVAICEINLTQCGDGAVTDVIKVALSVNCGGRGQQDVSIRSGEMTIAISSETQDK